MVDFKTPVIPSYVADARIVRLEGATQTAIFLYGTIGAGEKWFFSINHHQHCWKTLRKATEDEVRLIEGP